MARPRDFEETDALDAAIGCFWRRGYEATSVRDLAAAMGISGTSLYNAFDDKRTLFVRALDRYMAETARERIHRLERTLPPKQAIRRFIGEVIDRSVDDVERRGCFLINSALEVAPHDPELGEEIAQRLSEIEAFFRRTIKAGQAAGEIPAARDARDLSRLLLGVLLGIRVLARARPERALLEGVARPALGLLDSGD
ncbi:MAG: TetR/AcrR family transcriptional regulator [Hyphomicrobiales bacterium]|nr:TetR/AcrR family transcriptional regulator [Alphaproteobacteria bacterium]